MTKKRIRKTIEYNLELMELQKDYGILLSSNQINDAYYTGKCKEKVIQLLQTNQYDVFIDIGAAVGYFSVIASHHCIQVRAFEASSMFFGQLLYNTRFLYNVDTNYAYIGKKDTIPKTEEYSYKSLNMISKLPSMEKQYNIPVLTLNEILEEYPSPIKILVKMDIEGGEIEVLEGVFKEILQNKDIHWFIESHERHGVQPGEVIDFFPNREIQQQKHEVFIK